MPETKKPKAPPPKDLLPPRRVRGRATIYTEAISEELCNRISNGEPLRQICRDEHMPSWGAVYDWLEKDAKLASRVARARELGYDALAEEALQIADTPVEATKRTQSEDGMTVTTEDALGHRKLQIETRLKLLACWNPKRYGSKVAVGGDKNADPIQTEDIKSGALFDLIKNMEMKRRAG
jgi:hypothetical protein